MVNPGIVDADKRHEIFYKNNENPKETKSLNLIKN